MFMETTSIFKSSKYFWFSKNLIETIELTNTYVRNNLP